MQTIEAQRLTLDDARAMIRGTLQPALAMKEDIAAVTDPVGAPDNDDFDTIHRFIDAVIAAHEQLDAQYSRHAAGNRPVDALLFDVLGRTGALMAACDGVIAPNHTALNNRETLKWAWLGVCLALDDLMATVGQVAHG